MRIHSIISWVLGVCSLLLVVSIVENSLQIYAASQRLKIAQEKVSQLENQKYQLLEEQVKHNSPEYLEQQIRDKLKMVKPGEKFVVLPSLLQDKEEDLTYKYHSQEPVMTAPQPIWQEWMLLFR
jgi:cell division protein FtsB